MIQQLLTKNKGFFYPFFIWITIGAVYLFTNGKGDFSLVLNHQHNIFEDQFFKYGTTMGNGFFISAVCVLLLFVSRRFALVTTVSTVLASIVVQILKNIYNTDRPSLYFKDQDMHFVNGVRMLQHFSFPSGHSAGAFALFLSLALLVKDKRFGWVFFLLAAVVAFSRVYLLQHYLVDVYTGSIIAVIITTSVYVFFEKKNYFGKREFFDRSIIRRRSHPLPADDRSAH